MTRFLMLASLLCCAALAHAVDDGLLLYWKFDEGQGAVAKDASGQNLDGVVNAKWGESPAGGAALFDGTPATVVKANLPAEKRLGKESWTVMAWVKPQQFTIVGRQNQRRLFAYGAYPQAFWCVDIFGDGKVSFYQVYKAGEKSITSGVSSSTTLTLNQWAHVAVVCDRKAGFANIYINGRPRGEQKLPAEFDGDFSVSGEFTVGNAWQNYWGVADEVKLYKRALARGEIKAEFERLKDAFKVTPTAAEAAADAREAIQGSFESANAAWVKKDFTAVRQSLTAILANLQAPAHYRSYAHLRLAQSYVAAGQAAQAKAEYAKIAATADYPQVHRSEAEELARELDRAAKGLPPRDPEATRVRLVLPPRTGPGNIIFVAPNGNDANAGSEGQPLATLQKARDKARGLTNVEIVLAPGEYLVTETLALDDKDSGTVNAPVVYRAQQPGTAVLYGGVRLSGFAPVTDAAILERLPAEARGKVVQLDLKARGITDYGALAVRGFGQPPSPPTLELYVNQQPMTLARWPNEGFVKAARLVEPGDKKAGKPSVLGYEDERHARWTQAKDAWLFGYFHFLWADATAKIGRIDPAAKTITTAEAYQYGGRGMDTGQGIIYYAFNLLEEIDRPGEWYLDRDTGILYLYPPTDLAKATVELSMLSKPMIAATGVAHVRFEGLVFDLARGNGIVVKDSSDCVIAGCTVKRMAGNGISVLGGQRNTLLSCDVHTIGRRATEVIGGDRETLTPGGHVVANCHMHNFGRIDRTYTPGVQLEGVGNRVVHNLFFNCPSSVMRIEGNDHLIEFNEVRDAVLESDDQGAMELFRNPTYRGVIFRHNSFMRIGIPPGRQMAHGQAGIRFDDAISGMLVYGNVFYRAANGKFGGIQMNSGRDNIMDNNIFAECAQGISGGYGAGNNVWKQLREGKKPPEFFTTELYLKRYPEIARMMDAPGINFVWRNVFYRCGRDVTGNRNALDLLANGVFESDPGFVDAAKGDFRLKPGAPLFDSVGFRPIPVDEIGLYKDEWRTTLTEAK
jgi:parallel beta-helix repeat protein